MALTTIITDKMVFGGDCIAKIDGKTVFVPYAIPGEPLLVEIVKETNDYCQAKIVEIVSPSPHRVKPFCPLYGKCGGCNMQHIDTEYQTYLRSSILKDAFDREGVSTPEIEIIKGNPTGYRSRFQFHDGGLMERQSNNIIPLENCPCATEEINHFLSELTADKRPKGRVHVFASSHITSIPDGFDKIIIAKEEERAVQKEKNTNRYGKVNEQRRTANGRLMKKQKPIKTRFAGVSSDAQNLCTVDINGKNITFDVQGFFQSNLEVLSKTIPHVTEGLSGKNILDMYSGAGTFSVFLADKFEKVCMVEHNKAAIVYAEQNMAGTKHESFGVSGETWIKYHADNYIKQNGPFDAVVIDPPRSGMEKSVCQWLQASDIPQIRSISCDIATHARDAKFLIRAGYTLKKLYLLDFYPQTGHIESLAWFEK